MRIRSSLRPRTPRRVTGLVRRLLESLESAGEPRFLSFKFVSSDYRPRYCLSNCEAESRRRGVNIVFGWVVWELRSAHFIETEFHSVVEVGNDYVDITPRVDHDKLVLFAPDHRRVATRLDERSWDTWSNHRRQGAWLEPTRQIILQDEASNVWQGGAEIE